MGTYEFVTNAALLNVYLRLELKPITTQQALAFQIVSHCRLSSFRLVEKI